MAAVAEATAFWTASFGKSSEVPWPQFVRAYEDAVHCDTAADGTGPAFYCIANIISQGRLCHTHINTHLHAPTAMTTTTTVLTLNGMLTRDNFAVVVALLGPLAACATRCRELVAAGYFHGELSSDECRAVLAAHAAPGAFLLRLRRGTRGQLALAVCDERGALCHTLIDAQPGRYHVRQTTAYHATLPQLVAAFPAQCRVPVPSHILDTHGPASHAFPLSLLSSPFLSSPSAPATAVVIDVRAVAPGRLAGVGAALRALQHAQTELRLGVEGPVLAQTAERAGAAPAGGVLRALADQCRDETLVCVEIPALQARRKVRVAAAARGHEALARFLHRAPLDDMAHVGLYLPATGVWLDLDRPVASYLLAPECVVQVRHRPTAATAEGAEATEAETETVVVTVHNRVAGGDERIVCDAHTTVLGLVQACAKPGAARAARTGIRLFAHAPYFAVPDAPAAAYALGTALGEVEYDDAAQDAVFVPPAAMPAVRAALAPAQRLAAAIADLTRRLDAAVTQFLEGAPQQASQEPPQEQPQQQQEKPQQEEKEEVVVAATAEVKQEKEKQEEEEEHKEENEEQEMSAELEETMRWLADAAYVAAWWERLGDAGRAAPGVRAQAKAHVQRLFGAACASRAAALLDGGALTGAQLAALVQCLASVATAATASDVSTRS